MNENNNNDEVFWTKVVGPVVIGLVLFLLVQIIKFVVEFIWSIFTGMWEDLTREKTPQERAAQAAQREERRRFWNQPASSLFTPDGYTPPRERDKAERKQPRNYSNFGGE